MCLIIRSPDPPRRRIQVYTAFPLFLQRKGVVCAPSAPGTDLLFLCFTPEGLFQKIPMLPVRSGDGKVVCPCDLGPVYGFGCWLKSHLRRGLSWGVRQDVLSSGWESNTHDANHHAGPVCMSSISRRVLCASAVVMSRRIKTPPQMQSQLTSPGWGGLPRALL